MGVGGSTIPRLGDDSLVGSVAAYVEANRAAPCDDLVEARLPWPSPPGGVSPAHEKTAQHGATARGGWDARQSAFVLNNIAARNH